MNFAIVFQACPLFLSGALVTMQLTLLSVVFGLLLALLRAVALSSRHSLLRTPARVFVFYFRGTPLLVQLFLIYYGSGQFREALQFFGLWELFRDAWFCAVLSLSLNHGAYAAEILRGAIMGIPSGEVDAAKTCGMDNLLLLRRIVLPAAFRIAWPAYTNEVIFMLQATSLVSIITVMDLTGQAKMLAGQTYAVYESYCTAALLYLLMVSFFIWLFRRIERRLNRHLSC